MTQREELPVSVKKLEWSDGHVPEAKSIVGNYASYLHHSHVELRVDASASFSVSLGRIQLDKNSTLEQLKSAAQADYEARILSALVASPKREETAEPVAWFYEGVVYERHPAVSGAVPLYATPPIPPAEAHERGIEAACRAINEQQGSKDADAPRHSGYQKSWEELDTVQWTQWIETAEEAIAAYQAALSTKEGK